MDKINPYSVLGVAPDADDAAISQAYRRLAKTAHPDAGGTEEAFERIKLARDVLLDPERRAKFDNTGQIDPTVPDRIDAGAFGIIANMLGNALLGEEDPTKHPLIEPMVDFCTDSIRKQEQQLDKLTRAEDRAEAMMKRFRKRKKKKKAAADDNGRNVMQMVLTGKLDEIKRAKQGTEENMKVLKRALEIVQEYDFDWDHIQQVAYRYHSSTSAGGGGYFGGFL